MKEIGKFLELRGEFWELYYRAKKARRKKSRLQIMNKMSRILGDMRYLCSRPFQGKYKTWLEEEALKQLTKGGEI